MDTSAGKASGAPQPDGSPPLSALPLRSSSCSRVSSVSSAGSSPARPPPLSSLRAPRPKAPSNGSP